MDQSLTDFQEEHSTARYEIIRDVLRTAIQNNSLPHGLVLVETALAKLFNTSRIPVRQALQLLFEEQLISRFDGRGYLINPEKSAELKPLRTPITYETLGLDSEEELFDNRSLSERIHDELSTCVSTFMVFGHYQLNETRVAETFGVSRTIVREALMRIRDRGLVEKEPYSQWLTGPLTAQAVKEDYETRSLLEPEVLKKTAEFIHRSDLLHMLNRIKKAQANPLVSRSTIQQVEQDLHVKLLSPHNNKKLLGFIHQAQSSLNLGLIVNTALKINTNAAMLNEHTLVLEALIHGSPAAAAIHLKEHLHRAQQRALERLKVLSVLPEPELPPFLTRLA